MYDDTFEDVLWELNKIGSAIHSKDRIKILNTLHKHGKSTIEQISSSADIPRKTVVKNLTILESLLLVESQPEMIHPFVEERIYSLTGRGKRYFVSFESTVRQEFELLKNYLRQAEGVITHG